MRVSSEFSRQLARFSAISLFNNFSFNARSLLAAVVFVCAAASAHAAVVRGTVTDRLGAAVRGARVNLVQDGKVVTSAVSGYDGSYELTAAQSGRFVVTVIGTGFGLAVSPQFYSSTLHVVTEDIMLKPASVNSDVTVTATGVPKPEAQLTGTVDVIHGDDLKTRVGILDDLRLMPGVSVVQTGQVGGVTSLFVRGGSSSLNKVLIDGMPANDIGGYFDYGTISSTAIERVEVARGPVSVIYGMDASASALSFVTPRGLTARPLVEYSGDGGNYGSYRNEIKASGTRSALDYFLAFSRFDTSNGVPVDKYHDGTSAANIGYSLGATQVRFTTRYSVSATGVPGSVAFDGVSVNAKQSDQDLYSTGVIENRTPGDWHNLVRFGISRKREQQRAFAPVGTPVVSTFGSSTFTTYYGTPVTITGANGTSGSGQAAIIGITSSSNAVNDRNELTYQTDYRFTPHHAVYGSFRYDNETGVYQNPANFLFETVYRTNYEYTLLFEGDLWSRVFYTLGGGVVKNHVTGVAGVPQLGLAYYPVRPGGGLFQGTKLRFNFTRGVQDVNIAAEENSLRNILAANPPAPPALPTPPGSIPALRAETTRAYEGGIDQNIWSQKLLVKATFFHNEYGNQIEAIGGDALGVNYGLSPAQVNALDNNFVDAYVNTAAYRALGTEISVEYRPLANFFIRGGYTYLDTKTQKSFASSALAPDINPKYPNTPIGAFGPLVGARQFRIPPHSGYIALAYTYSKWSQAAKIAMVSRSDDSTFLEFSDLAGDNALLLPNRNLDYGYVKIDLNETYQVNPRLGVFAQLDNLLGQQQIGPIGYQSLPFTFRAGVKASFGGNR
jgi:vitamin B12 transporter